jgi:hypothetical protein
MYTVTITVSGGLITGVYAAGAGPQDIRAVVVDFDNKSGSGEPEECAPGEEWGGYEETVLQLEADAELLELSRVALACEKCGEVECYGGCDEAEDEAPIRHDCSECLHHEPSPASSPGRCLCQQAMDEHKTCCEERMESDHLDDAAEVCGNWTGTEDED